MIGAFDDEGFENRVYFRHRVVDRSWVMSRVLVIFPFDPKRKLISRSDLFIFLSKTFVKVALVVFLGPYEWSMGVRKGYG